MISLLLTVALINPLNIQEKVDIIELNHFHDVGGNYVYSQYIFWDWDHEYDDYVVRGWVMDEKKQLFKTEQYKVIWKDNNNKIRTITSDHFRESWTQKDPERENQKNLPQDKRIKLVE